MSHLPIALTKTHLFRSLNPMTRHILHVLYSVAAPGDQTSGIGESTRDFGSINNLSVISGLAKKTVEDAVKLLRELNLISVKAQKKRRTNVYSFLVSSEIQSLSKAQYMTRLPQSDILRGAALKNRMDKATSPMGDNDLPLCETTTTSSDELSSTPSGSVLTDRQINTDLSIQSPIREKILKFYPTIQSVIDMKSESLIGVIGEKTIIGSLVNIDCLLDGLSISPNILGQFKCSLEKHNCVITMDQISGVIGKVKSLRDNGYMEDCSKNKVDDLRGILVENIDFRYIQPFQAQKFDTVISVWFRHRILMRLDVPAWIRQYVKSLEADKKCLLGKSDH